VYDLIRSIGGRRPQGACPLVTGYGKMMLAELDYALKPRPTAPPWDHDSREETCATRVLPAMSSKGIA